MNILEELLKLKDEKYADFNQGLIPTIDRESVIGVRVPMLRKLAKTIYKNNEFEDFLKCLPHSYYDENALHSLIISEFKGYEDLIGELERFLPYVDNWAVCDILSPKIFKKNRARLIEKIKTWIKSEHTYTSRFGMGMLMQHYLDEDFDRAYLHLVSDIKSEEYYVRMMQAWYFATALAKQWDCAIKILEQEKLQPWVHNKTIQKAVESYRISDEKKKYLRTLKKDINKK